MGNNKKQSTELAKKQTAVDWLINIVEEHFCLLPVDLIEQARAIDKEQKKEAWYDCFHNGQGCEEKNDPAEEYYKEIYNN